MMRKLTLAIAITIMSFADAAAQTRLVIDTEGVNSSEQEIRSATADLTGKLTSKWRKERKDLTATEQDNILRGSETLVAYRYLTLPATADTTIVHLCLAAQPVGLIVLTKGDETLGTAYVNESGGIEFSLPEDGDKAAEALTQQMRAGERYVICGIDQPYKLFHEEDGKMFATDMTTGTTSTYDTASLPDYVFTGTHQHHTATVVGSVIGGIITLGVIALVAIL